MGNEKFILDYFFMGRGGREIGGVFKQDNDWRVETQLGVIKFGCTKSANNTTLYCYFLQHYYACVISHYLVIVFANKGIRIPQFKNINAIFSFSAVAAFSFSVSILLFLLSSC